MSDLLCKANLTRSLNVMRMLFPDEFEFYPKTWFIPEQIEQFQEDARSIHKADRRKRHRLFTTFIVKPSGLSINPTTLLRILSFAQMVQKVQESI